MMPKQVRQARRAAGAPVPRVVITDPWRRAILGAGDLLLDWDLVAGGLALSDNALEVLGFEPAGVAGGAEGFLGFVHPDDAATRQDGLERHLRDGSAFDAEYRLCRPDGTHCWLHERGSALRDEAGRPLRLLSVGRITTERREHQARLEHLATHDELTGQFNRARLREALAFTFAYSQRYRVPSALLLVGIDNLTVINDAYGFEVADAMIVEIARRLEACFRSTDVIARIAGNRFAILLTNCPEHLMATSADKILRAIRSTVIDTPLGPVAVTVSVGGVALPTGAADPQEALLHAEEALDRAKATGRDCFASYEPSESRTLARRRNLEIAERLVSALREDRLRLAFQPLVSAADGRVLGHECLLRMIENDKVLSAGAFMPVIEQLGLARVIDGRALDLAMVTMRQHPQARLSLNVSALTTSDRTWLRTLHRHLRDLPGAAERLTIEVTETAAIRDLEESGRFIEDLKKAGVRVSLDDFGAGYTSLKYMKGLEVDEVKIDGSFVRGIAVSPQNRLFVRTLIDLARGFGLDIVAECVETERDAETLRSMGVHALQGYLFGRPDFPPYGAV